MDGDIEDNCHRKLWLRRGRTCNTLVTDRYADATDKSQG